MMSILFKSAVLLLACCLVVTLADRRWNVTIKFPGYKPVQDDDYQCYSIRVDTPTYVVGFEPLSDMTRAHHMLLYTCETPVVEGQIYPCGHTTVCKKGMKVIYAWAKNAPALRYPAGVGTPVGVGPSTRYLVLNIHYATVLPEPDYSGVRLLGSDSKPQFLTGVYLMAASIGNMVPAHVRQSNMTLSCRYEHDEPLHVFAFRTHAHTLGRVISGFRVRDNKWHLIGRGSPLWPQAFYPAETDSVILKNDYLVARCVFDSTDRATDTYIGMNHDNEMCNFYMMFYSPHANTIAPDMHGLTCLLDAYPRISRKIPEIANVIPNSLPAGGLTTSPSLAPSLAPSLSLVHNTNWKYTMEHLATQVEFTVGQVSGVAVTPSYGGTSSISPNDDSVGTVVLFHRAGRHWTMDTFNLSDNLLAPKEVSKGRIKEPTVIEMDIATGKILRAWGRNRFYIPHGVHVDGAGNIWLTDVGLHQVFKFSSETNGASNSSFERELVFQLGTEFMPGNGHGGVEYFCKPSAVAVDVAFGLAFIADGYCNSRVVIVSATDGKYHGELGARSGSARMNLVHDIALQSIGASIGPRWLCAADRMNGRLACFVMPDYHGELPTDDKGKAELAENVTGALTKQTVHTFTSDLFKPQLMAIGFSGVAGQLFVVNYQPATTSKSAVSLVELPSADAVKASQSVDVKVIFSGIVPPGDFGWPHTLAVSSCHTNGTLFVADLTKSWRVAKFDLPNIDSMDGHSVRGRPGVSWFSSDSKLGKKVHSVVRYIRSNRWSALVGLLLIVGVLTSCCMLFVCRFRRHSGSSGTLGGGSARFGALTDLFTGIGGDRKKPMNVSSWFNSNERHRSAGFTPLRQDDEDDDGDDGYRNQMRRTRLKLNGGSANGNAPLDSETSDSDLSGDDEYYSVNMGSLARKGAPLPETVIRTEDSVNLDETQASRATKA